MAIEIGIDELAARVTAAERQAEVYRADSVRDLKLATDARTTVRRLQAQINTAEERVKAQAAVIAEQAADIDRLVGNKHE